MAEPKDYGPHDIREPVDPGGKNLAAAIKEVFDLQKPSEKEKAKFFAKFAGKHQGVG